MVCKFIRYKIGNIIMSLLTDKQKEQIQKLADEVLVEAQNLAPVGSGNLKAAHKSKIIKNGFQIIVDVPYAYALHEGKKQEEQRTEGTYKSIVRKHFRTRSSGRPNVVRAHTKSYKQGYKPMKMPDGNWATMNVSKQPKKQGWLQEAWKIVRRKQSPVNRNFLQSYLRIED